MKARWILPAICVGVVALTTFAPAPAEKADAFHNRLVGTWRVNIGIPDVFCFPSYMVFHTDRTMTERSGFLTDTASSGAWRSIGGSGNYAATFEGFQEFPPESGEMIGFRIRMTLHVEGNAISGSAAGDQLDWKTGEFEETFVTGFPVVGRRVEVLRE